MAKFTVKSEHIRLMKELNFKVSVMTELGDDRYKPVIDFKRPFGNSAVIVDVCETLGYQCDEVSGKYSKEDVEKAKSLLIELPLALHIVMRNQTFEPGAYEVDEHSPVYYNYVHMRNYHALEAPLAEMEEKCKGVWNVNRLHEICMNISGDDPWAVLDELKSYGQNAFLQTVAKVFEKHRDNL